MRKAIFGFLYVLTMLVGFSIPTTAQDRGYPISKKDGPLHKAEVVAVLKTPGACSSATWREMFHVSCQQLLEMFRTVDPSSSLTQVSELLGYIEQLTEAKCPVGLAQVATIRKGPNTAGVIDYNYRRPFGREELCLYNRNNSTSGMPIVPIDCWNGVKGYRTSEELAQIAKPQVVEKEKVVERATNDTLRFHVGSTAVSANGLGTLKDGQVISVRNYGYLRLIDLRTPTKPETTYVDRDRPVPGPRQSVWKSKKFWGAVILTGIVAGIGGHELGQRNVECLPCRK